MKSPRSPASGAHHRAVASQEQNEELAPAPRTKTINLALQGGGAHGAFTWGVLDQFLEDPRIFIEGISGTSAGAINAVLLAHGLAQGGAADARAQLAAFWRAASRDGGLPDAQRNVLDRLFWFLPMAASPVQAWFDLLSQYFSPYDLNPLDINPLRELIRGFVDFDAVRRNNKLQLFVAATNVQTGRVRVFSREHIDADVITASTCLPLLFRSVEIAGTPYWDGGYMGNPSLFPLFRATQTEDVVIVQINPLFRATTPTTPKEIVNRINEISFNSSLMAEIRAIDFVVRLLSEGKLQPGKSAGHYRDIKVHRIALDHGSNGLDAGSKLDNDFDFFLKLHDMGRLAARTFLDQNFEHIGVRSTVDLAAESRAEWA